jgi:predicted transcriptional regulator
VGFRIRTGKRGLELRLYDLEAEIMQLVWASGLARFAVSDVLTVLEKRRPIAYTTVMTTLARLYDKGVLQREREGKRYLYSPRLSRDAFLEATAREVLETLKPRARAMALLAESVSEADEATLDELEAMIQRRRRELGE